MIFFYFCYFPEDAHWETETNVNVAFNFVEYITWYITLVSNVHDFSISIRYCVLLNKYAINFEYLFPTKLIRT